MRAVVPGLVGLAVSSNPNLLAALGGEWIWGSDQKQAKVKEEGETLKEFVTNTLHMHTYKNGVESKAT